MGGAGAIAAALCAAVAPAAGRGAGACAAAAVAYNASGCTAAGHYDELNGTAAATAAACCAACGAQPRCFGWTFHRDAAGASRCDLSDAPKVKRGVERATCGCRVAGCGRAPPAPAPAAPTPAPPQCGAAIVYNGSGCTSAGNYNETTTATVAECCAACSDQPRCFGWTFHHDGGRCYLSATPKVKKGVSQATCGCRTADCGAAPTTPAPPPTPVPPGAGNHPHQTPPPWAARTWSTRYSMSTPLFAEGPDGFLDYQGNGSSEDCPSNLKFWCKKQGGKRVDPAPKHCSSDHEDPSWACSYCGQFAKVVNVSNWTCPTCPKPPPPPPPSEVAPSSAEGPGDEEWEAMWDALPTTAHGDKNMTEEQYRTMSFPCGSPEIGEFPPPMKRSQILQRAAGWLGMGTMYAHKEFARAACALETCGTDDHPDDCPRFRYLPVCQGYRDMAYRTWTSSISRSESDVPPLHNVDINCSDALPGDTVHHPGHTQIFRKFHMNGTQKLYEVWQMGGGPGKANRKLLEWKPENHGFGCRRRVNVVEDMDIRSAEDFTVYHNIILGDSL